MKKYSRYNHAEIMQIQKDNLIPRFTLNSSEDEFEVLTGGNVGAVVGMKLGLLEGSVVGDADDGECVTE